MRRSLVFILRMLLLICWPTIVAHAQESHVLGYCTDDLTGAGKFGINAEVRLSGAIYLPNSIMQRYKGGQVTRIRVALSEGIEKPSVWIRTSLTENSKVTQSVGQMAEGWNEVTLNRPLDIDGSGLYVGFTYTQPAGAKGIYVQGEGNANTSLLGIDNVWDDFHYQGVGILCIQAVAEAELPAHDLGVIEMSVDSDFYRSTSQLKATAIVENLGSADTEGYTIDWAIDGKGIDSDETVYGPLAPGETREATHIFNLDGLDEGEHYVQLTLHPVGTDQKVDNDTFRTAFYTYATSYDRMLLLEHFTSLPCVNCPPVDNLLEEVVDARDDVAWVAHHVGYRNDEFTLAASEPYLKFGVTGNPYIMLDRCALFSETPAFVVSTTSAEVLGTYFDMVAQRPAFVALTASLVAEEGQLTAAVNGETRSFFQNLYPRATLNVFLVEDDTPSEGTQAGDSNKRRHDNVLRAVLTRQSGDLPGWTDDTHFSQTFTTNADGSWDVNHLRVVAFVTAAADRSTKYPTGEVLNATQATALSPEGVANIPVETTPTPRCYTIDGRLVKGMSTPGLYIVTDSHGSRKVVVR